jgi:hypothetical protein
MQSTSVVVLFALAVSAFAVVPPVAKPEQLNVECTLCEIIVPVIAHLLESEEPDVEAKLDGFCDQIFSWSGIIDSTCKNYINENLQKITDLINSGTEVSNICAKLNACPASALVAQRTKPVVVKDDGLQCEVCTGLISVIEGLVKADEPQLKSKLDAYCGELPAFLTEACVALVNTELDNIVGQLENNETPQQICENLRLCQNTRAAAFVAKQKAAFMAKAKAIKPVKLNELECGLCDLVVAYAAEELAAPEGDLQNKLEKFCESIPVIGGVCESYVKQFGDIIQQDLKDGKGAKEICTGLHAC